MVKPDPEVLGQILILNNLLHAAPNEFWLGEVTVNALARIPSVKSAAIYFNDSFLAGSSCVPTDSFSWPKTWLGCDVLSSQGSCHGPFRSVSIQTPRKRYGTVALRLESPEAFSPYQPYIENTVNTIALVIETNRQQAYMEALTEGLEKEVATKATELIEKETRLGITEEYLQKITIATQDAIIIIDSQGNISFWNPAAEKILGYRPEEVMGSNLHQLLAPERYLAAYQKKFREFLRTGSGNAVGRTVELAAKRKDGQEIALELSLSSFSLNGQWHAVGILRDITERKAVEEKLLVSEEKFAKAFQNSPLMMAISDVKTGRYLDVNDAFCQTVGFRKEEIIGRTVLELGWIRTADGSRLYEELLAQGRVTGRELAVTDRTGQSLWCLYFGEFISTSSGNVLLSIAQDITQRRREEQMVAAELRLGGFAVEHSSGQVLQKFLDEVEVLTSSEIGFYHFVEDDQETLHLMAWSTNTLSRMCTAEGAGSHYPISRAGVWVDCVQQRRPVIHNNYAKLPHKKGLPQGHAAIVRELVVPVFRNDKLVAILGVGNKKSDYDETDVKIVQRLADLAWETIMRKRVEEALCESEELYRVLVNTIPMGILLMDQDFRIVKINAAQADLFQRPPASLIGRRCYEAFEKRDRVCPYCPGVTSLQTGSVAHAEVRGSRDDGSRTWVRLHTAPVQLPNGNIGFIKVVEEISEQRELEARTQQMARLSALGEMASGVAHEINNPINGIINCAQLLHDRLPPEHKCQEIVDRISREGDRIAKIVRSLLSIARPGQHVKESFAVKECFESVLALSRSKLFKNDIALQVDIPDNLPNILGERQQIEQLILNLLNNSQHALNSRFPEQHPGKCLSLSAMPCFSAGREVLCVEFYDQGTGIPRENLVRIFDPFFTTKPAGEGTGLGLGLCHEIVKRHHGEIRVESEYGEFTRVTVELPLA